MTLNNRRFLTRQNIEILNASIKVEKKNLLDSVEYEIPFENIHNKKRVQTVTNSNHLVLSFLLLVIGLLFQIPPNIELSIVFLLLAALFLGLALFTRQRTITIPTYDGGKVELYFNHKNRNEIVEFTNKIIDASNRFLLRKYGTVDKALPLEGQINNLNFLRDREVITNEEYDTLKNQLLGRDNRSSLGFGR